MTWRELAAWSAHEKALTNGKGRIDAVIAACNAYKLFNGEQPTALTDEEWKEIQSKAHSYHRSIWKHDIHKALSRRTAEPHPAAEPPFNVLYEDSTGGLHCDLAVADAAEPSTAPSEEIMPLADVKWDAPSPASSGDAALEVARFALEELACLGNGNLRGNSNGNCIAIRALDKIARLTPKPVERVTVGFQENHVQVYLDDEGVIQFKERRDAERYAAGLRAELAKEATDSK